VSTGPLHGLRVLDMASLFAAPQVAAVLGDFGADVVKVEPPGGDALRHIGLQRDGQSLMWALANRNKRAVTLDTDVAEGRELFDRLVAGADVLVENFTAERAAAERCTFDELHAVNPRLIVVSVTCFGRTGPYAARPGNGTLAESFAGLTHMTGPPHGAPVLASVPLGDLLTGIVGALGAVLACYHRDVNRGEGQHVDVSMFEPVLQLLASAAIGWVPGTPAPMRSGSRVSGGSVRNVYRTGDEQWVVVSATTAPQLARLLGLMAGDSTPSARPDAPPGGDATPEELDRAVAGWVGAKHRDDLLSALDGARIPAAPVNDLASIWDDPHVRARQSLVSLPGSGDDPLVFVSPAPRLGTTPGTVAAPGPALGAHTAEVYREWLGLLDTELAGLRDRHVI
jgi:crotonobetainyl-CoA:carnitine CoA-transferase CaiB-like acyl-CoA transferase